MINDEHQLLTPPLSPAGREHGVGLKGVIFDLGGTLIARAGNHERTNATALWQWLRERRHAVEEEFVDALVAEREATFARRTGTREIRAEEALRPVLARYGAPANLALLVAAEAAFFEPELQAMRLLPGALELLETLDARGLRQGLISNASSHYFILECCRRLELDRYLDPVLSSAAIGWAKPDPRIFEAILTQWGYPPASALMVGDTVEADIAGARGLGMRSILLMAERRADEPVEVEGVRADALAATLAEVGFILEEWLAR